MKREIEKEIKERFENYKNITNKIKGLELKLEKQKMIGCPRDIGAIDYSKVGGGGSGGQSADTILIQTQGILEQINGLRIEKEIMDNFIDTLTQSEYEFVTLYYFDKLTLNEILDKMGYSMTSKAFIYKQKMNVENKYIDFV